MKYRVLAVFTLLSSPAFAQQWSNVNLINPFGYVPFSLDGQSVASVNPNVIVSGCNAAQTSCGFAGINIQNFEEASLANGQFAHFNLEISKATQLAITAAAMKDAIPNEGDRFALRLNMATWDGNAAGSVGFSANVSNSVRLSADYGRSQNENIFSGGINLSFH